MAGAHERLLITGAAGALGRVLREAPGGFAAKVRLGDIARLSDLEPHEEFITADLSDRGAVRRLMDGVDAVVHLAAVTSEQGFDEIARSNIIGQQNIFAEAAAAGVKRIVWGSSNHAIGFYPASQTITPDAPPRPDSLYGASKAFGEALAQYYWEKSGLECVSVRIGSCVPQPVNRRMLATWLSYPDFQHLIDVALRAPDVGHTVIYGVSNNDARFWDNRPAGHLGYQPQDNAETFRAEIERSDPNPDPASPLLAFHGGDFVETGR